MVDSRLAKRYAQALFRQALAHGIVPAVESDLNTIVRLLEANAEFREFLMSPTNGREEKIGFVERVFSDRVTALTLQALRLVLTKRRETTLFAITAAYVELRRQHDGIVYATVTSAEALTDGHKNAIVHKLADHLGKQIEPNFVVDPSVVGGVKVAYDDFVLDGTVKGAFARLRDKLRYDLLKQS